MIQTTDYLQKYNTLKYGNILGIFLLHIFTMGCTSMKSKPSLHYSYDQFGRISEMWGNHNLPDDGANFRELYTYDSDGRLFSKRYYQLSDSNKECIIRDSLAYIEYRYIYIYDSIPSLEERYDPIFDERQKVIGYELTFIWDLISKHEHVIEEDDEIEIVGMDSILADMDAFFNRPIYDTLTKEILDTIPENDLVMTVTDNIWSNLGDDYDSYHEKSLKLTEGQRAVIMVSWVEGEVNNGGFNQYYYNSDGQYMKLALEGFKRIGAVRHARLMKTANAAYAKNQKLLEKYDDETLQSFSDSYEERNI